MFIIIYLTSMSYRLIMKRLVNFDKTRVLILIRIKRTLRIVSLTLTRMHIESLYVRADFDRLALNAFRGVCRVFVINSSTIKIELRVHVKR